MTVIKSKADIKVKSWSKIVGFVNHHTAGKHRIQFEEVNDQHRLKNWGTKEKPYYTPKSELGFYVGYNFLIEKSGVIRQARKIGETTLATIGYNRTMGSICLAGDFRTEKPTEAQIASLKQLYGWILESKAVPMYYRHGDMKYNSTECPKLPQSFYKEIQKEVAKGVLSQLQIILNKQILKLKQD